MISEKNAKITSTMLGIEDHGIMTFRLHLDYGGGGQGFGGYGLSDNHKGIKVIKEVLRVVGVREWEDLPGKLIRVRAESSKVHSIGNALDECWLDLSEFFAEEED